MTTQTYRLDYSPKCLDCSNYDYDSDSCFWEDESDSPTPTYPSCNNFSQRDDLYCPSCGRPVDEYNDETIDEPDGYEEFWGARVQRPYIIVAFICANCNETIPI